MRVCSPVPDQLGGGGGGGGDMLENGGEIEIVIKTRGCIYM